MPCHALTNSYLQEIDFLHAQVEVSGDNVTFDLDEVGGDICLPRDKLEVKKLYKVTIYGTTSRYAGSEMHRIVLGEELGIRLSTE